LFILKERGILWLRYWGIQMKTLIKSIVYGVFACMFISMTAHAQEETVKLRTFKTDFISFQLSNQWNCQMDGTEYVCRPEAKFKKADAIIIIAAKIPGKEDNLKAYMHYLKEPKKITDYKGRPLHSKVSFAKVKPIQATEWVDAIHVSSEPVKSIKSHEFSEQPYLFSTLRYAALDKQGRMLLHEDEKKTCGISEKVKLIGFDDKIQIWDYEMFESYIKNMRIRQTK